MNNQYKPLPTPKPIKGCVTQPKSTDPHAPIAGTETPRDKKVGNVGVKNSETFGGNTSGDAS